ncbi:hypothetical protein IA69_00035 [Massilia sp. JS1662]|nr:hypothetical protein IA69_00035 [Massilia sp. JS1662]
MLAALRGGSADVVLVGLGLLRHVGAGAFRAAGGACRVIVHSYEWDRDFGTEASRFGAAGYLSHDCTREDLCAAVLDVAAGGQFATRDTRVVLAEAACFRASACPRTAFSARERQVFRMLAIGLRVHQIATQLGISLQDAVECKWRVAAKIDVTAAGELVRYAVAQTTRAWPRPEFAARPMRSASL